jgi:hypothetical protein
MEQGITAAASQSVRSKAPRTRATSPAAGILAVARVHYLEAAYRIIRSELLPEAPPVDQIALAWSFPSKGARGKTIGECHYAIQGSHETAAIVIHPREWSKEDVEVLAILAHEMVHAALGPGVGHRGPFPQMAERIGLAGKPTATVAGSAFRQFIAKVRESLPPFPVGGIGLAPTKKAGTRLRLWECGCGVKVRVARDDFAATCDECGEAFELKQGARPSKPGQGGA